MQVTPLKTPIVHTHDSLIDLLNQTLPRALSEKTVVVITSKIIALCEGAVSPVGTGERSEKHELVAQEAEYYIDPHSSKYDLMLTIKDQIVAVNAGIDESNADGQYVLFPKDPYASARAIWQFLREEYQLEQVGVLITDSKTFPLRWGTIGTMLAYCGFKSLNDKRGTKDLFGRELKMTQVNVAEALAVAAVLEMGESNESQPLALITDVDMVEFVDHPPSAEELKNLTIELEDDAYAPVLMSAAWKKGGAK